MGVGLDAIDVDVNFESFRVVGSGVEWMVVKDSCFIRFDCLRCADLFHPSTILGSDGFFADSLGDKVKDIVRDIVRLYIVVFRLSDVECLDIDKCVSDRPAMVVYEGDLPACNGFFVDPEDNAPLGIAFVCYSGRSLVPFYMRCEVESSSAMMTGR